MTVNLSIKKIAKLLAGRSAEEIEDVLGDIVPSDNGHVEEKQPKHAPTAKRSPREANGKSTQRASIVEVNDWKLIGAAAEFLGVKIGYIKQLVTDGAIASNSYGPFTVVHVRQIAYYMKHGKAHDVDLSVFEHWYPINAAEEQLGVKKNTIRYLMQADKIAFYKTGNGQSSPTLVNIDECWRVLGK